MTLRHPMRVALLLVRHVGAVDLVRNDWQQPTGSYSIDLNGGLTLSNFASGRIEPDATALLIAGLGVTAFVSRRRRASAG